MQELIFATGNAHKLREAREMLGDKFQLKSLIDIGCSEDIPETSNSIEGNALQKARYVFDHFGIDCFAEDTGLEVDSLNGEPGIFSARYAGEAKNAEANMDLLLKKMEAVENRRAQFRTVIALILEGKEYTFEGVAIGDIRRSRSGSGGFGYDPIFQPDGFHHTFAELSASEKNAVSHRGQAIQKLIRFLKNLSD